MADSKAADPQVGEAMGEETKMADSMSTGWTDEKHSLYLNSMETSFVNQLYSNDYLSQNFLGWYSSIGKNTNSSGSSANNLRPHEFKVQRGGSWTKVKFEKARRRVDIENQSRSVSANSWIQHFRPSIVKDQVGITSSNKVDDNALGIDSVDSPRHGKEATSSKQPPTIFPPLGCQDSLEVSDQNFVDDVERVEQSTRSCCKKRGRIAINNPAIKDQVVPSGKASFAPTSYERHAHLREEVAECRSGEPADNITVFQNAAADNQQQ